MVPNLFMIPICSVTLKQFFMLLDFSTHVRVWMDHRAFSKFYKMHFIVNQYDLVITKLITDVIYNINSTSTYQQLTKHVWKYVCLLKCFKVFLLIFKAKFHCFVVLLCM